MGKWDKLWEEEKYKKRTISERGRVEEKGKELLVDTQEWMAWQEGYSLPQLQSYYDYTGLTQECSTENPSIQKTCHCLARGVLEKPDVEPPGERTGPTPKGTYFDPHCLDLNHSAGGESVISKDCVA